MHERILYYSRVNWYEFVNQKKRITSLFMLFDKIWLHYLGGSELQEGLVVGYNSERHDLSLGEISKGTKPKNFLRKVIDRLKQKISFAVYYT